MPRLSQRPPKYRYHKASGQAVVTLGGRDVYLGRYGSEESKQAYSRLVGEWVAGGQQAKPQLLNRALVIDELIAAYLKHADQYYRKHGTPTDTIHSIRAALSVLHESHGCHRAR